MIESPASPAQTQWNAVAEIARRGLSEFYPEHENRLPHTVRWREGGPCFAGYNLRYALIAIIGLAKSRELAGNSDVLRTRIWVRVGQGIKNNHPLSAGDWGLGLWAAALDPEGARIAGEPFSACRALAELQAGGPSCDSAELAWLLLGAEHALAAAQGGRAAQSLAAAAHGQLLGLYNPRSGLFFRHARRGLGSISRRVACFANQIYPLMALALYARHRDCEPSKEIVAQVAERLCQHQGPLGQWWWLYDAATGDIVDGYPVFSVHQDGMAPMALLEASRITGVCYDRQILRGLDWVHGSNELRESMVRASPALILRDIHKRRYGRVRRMMRGALWCSGVRFGQTATRHRIEFTINRECRPYHLAWALYAATLWGGKGGV
jgi:hypothetical protein